MRGSRYNNFFGPGPGIVVPSWVLPGATVDMDFANGRYFGGTLASLVTAARASSKTDLLPASASGFAYNTFLNNALAVTPGSGALIEEARTNVLLNSAAPATQTTASLAVGTYTLWVNGSGSATPSAGTATITGAGTATNGVPDVFVVTVAGTVTITVAGALNAFQCELGAFGTSFIPTAGAPATRAADSVALAGLAATTLQVTNGASVLAQAGPSANAVAGIQADLLSLDNAVNHLLVFLAGGGNTVSSRHTSNVTAAFGVGSLLSPVIKAAAAWSQIAVTNSVVVNNGAVATGTLALSGSSNMLGSDAGGSFYDGYFQRLSAWNSRLTDATLKGLTV